MMTRSPIHLVLCEGTDDQRVMEGLATHSGFAEKLQFRSYAESGTLRSYLVTLSKSPDFVRGEIRSLLVTRDADDDFSGCWRSIQGAVRDAFGADLVSPGQWVEIPNGPKVAAWINPGPDQTGMLESLCLEAARDTHPEVFPCIDSFVECIGTAWGVPVHEKSRFHIWSIVAQGPGPKDRLSLGRALEHLPPNWDSKAFDSLREMLRAAVS